jgi:hypothetical protein
MQHHGPAPPAQGFRVALEKISIPTEKQMLTQRTSMANPPTVTKLCDFPHKAAANMCENPHTLLALDISANGISPRHLSTNTQTPPRAAK